MQAFLVKKKLTVIKFGGSSLANNNLIKKCAERVMLHLKTEKVIVVVSAMFGVTNKLLQQIEATGLTFNTEATKLTTEIGALARINKSKDLIVTTGENISAGLFATQLENLGVSSVAICGWQVPIKIRNQKIVDIDQKKLQNLLNNGITPVVTGFQGIDEDGFIAALKRGGSDTTATALAAAFRADTCYIYTDLNGVYEVSPELLEIDKNYHISEISYDQMYEMSLNGAKIMSSDSIEFAKKELIPIEVRSVFQRDTYQVENRDNLDEILINEKYTIIKETAQEVSSFLIKQTAVNNYRISCCFKKFSEENQKLVEDILNKTENYFLSSYKFTFETNDKNDPIIYILLRLFIIQLRT